MINCNNNLKVGLTFHQTFHEQRIKNSRLSGERSREHRQHTKSSSYEYNLSCLPILCTNK